ncbi:toll-like receptor 8 isoform X2 [Lepisosteus oculatus]|uniref:toll-like receptor 8 isoform X1 n=1 Tax=Lepisosteus oculatus TaxID=7918 RepID=UPI0035F5167E
MLTTSPLQNRMLCLFVITTFVPSILTNCWVSKHLPCDVMIRNDTSILFDCSARRLTVVPTDIKCNVTSLRLSQNQIQHISNESFWNLENLIILNLKWNRDTEGLKIAKGSFTALKKLKILLLDGNLLSTIPEDLPHELNILSLSSNNIASIGSENFKGIPNIKEIRLNKNCYHGNGCNNSLIIHNDTFSNVLELEKLSLNLNRLTRVPQNLPKYLKSLSLTLNKIERVNHFDLENLTELRTLDLSGNCPRCQNAPFPCETCKTPKGSIEVDPHAFQSLVNLEELHLSGNSLVKVHASWFQNCTKLKYLFLSFNFLISEIATGEFLNVLPHVEVIDLSFNYAPKSYPRKIKLSSNFSKLEALRALHIEGYVFRILDGNDLNPLFSLKNLSLLNVGTNFLQYIHLTLFQNFFNLSLIYLSENRLASLSQRNDSIYANGNEADCVLNKPLMKYHGNHEEKGTYIVHKDKDYRLSHPLVKQQCLRYGPVLDLSKNNIFYISPELFKGLENTTCLNLSKNSIADSFNGTEFIHLPKLKYLDLSYNKIDLAYDYAFSELTHLEVLDLSNNPHYFVVAGVTHNLNFVKHLQVLKVLNLSQNEIFTLTEKEMSSSSLKELQFQGNRLDILWKNDERYIRLFTNLLNLTHLDMSHNKLQNIPSAAYENFPKTLTHLFLNNNKLNLFKWEKLIYFECLEVLDLSNNKIESIAEHIANYTKMLRKLYLGNNKISRLSDGFLRGARSLSRLYLDNNNLSLINTSTFLSGPENYLKTLSLKGNPFQCTCEIFDFLLWVEGTDIVIPRLATDVTCATPERLKRNAVIGFDRQQCIIDGTSAILFLASSSIIAITVAVAITQHLFYWDVWYIFHYLKAKMKGYHYLKSTESIYDAFITYDTKDPVVSDWVLNHLRVQLEENGEKLFPICLEERDWHPGAPVIDNLSQSIKQSRKTVFVLTEGYVKSGTFKIAFYLAHQRLLDDNTDVIVLVLLEPVLLHSQFFRLRKRLCRKTILEWPKNPRAEKWFWHCLRNIIRVEHQAVYNKLYSCYFINK